MTPWQQVGTITSAVFALGDFTIAAMLMRNIVAQHKSYRKHRVRSTYTFPRIRTAITVFFVSAGTLRVVDILAGDRLTPVLIIMRIVHGLILWYLVLTLWRSRKAVSGFIDAISEAEMMSTSRTTTTTTSDRKDE